MEQSCWYCGAPLNIAPDEETKTCNYCHHEIRIDSVDKFESDNLTQAADYRNHGDFKQAEKIYEEIIAENKKNYKAIWGKLLCKYGVVYIERENTARVLTCRRLLDSSFTAETDYIRVRSLASGNEAEQFWKDAEMITSIQNKIRELKDKKDKDYDIFICYKETEDTRTGSVTTDSYDAEILYNVLCDDGYRVFFAKKALKNKAGADYEAEIFNAISKAKVMLVLGSKAEYFTSTWVKSEWTRFLEAMKEDKKKKLIPLIKNLHFNQLPKEIKKQGLDYRTEYSNNFDGLKRQIKGVFSNESKAVFQSAPKEDDAAREAVLKIEEGDAEEGMRELRHAAENHSPDAWYLLGCVLYQNREDRDACKEAFLYFKKAADAGYADARFQTAFMYEFGVGTDRNIEKAEQYYRGLDRKVYPIPNID